MPPALPFPAHKHPPSTVGPLGILNSLPGGLPADQGDSAPIEETPAGEEGTPPDEVTEGGKTDGTAPADGNGPAPPAAT